jgi:molecular chaperone DnaK
MRPRHVLLALVLVTGCEAHGRVTVEEQSPAIVDGVLVEPVGIETLGGVFTQLLPQQCRLPCGRTEVFSTAADNQLEVRITLFRGQAKMAAQAHPLGTFVVQGLAPAPRGQPAIAVTFNAADHRIELRAVDRKAGRRLSIIRAASPQEK